MLAVSSDRIVCLSTPFGKRGFFFEEWANGQRWNRLKVTADECPRISPEFLEEERRALGPHWFARNTCASSATRLIRSSGTTF